MAKDVIFNIKLMVDGKEQIAKASVDVKKFSEELTKAQAGSNKLRDQLIKFTGIATSFQNLASGLQQLTGAAQTYIDANKVQVEAETKLETVMRQRMAATDEEIQGIKELASAQQALGVIGDEVQLSGAQQMATFLKEKASIETLLPAMNNLLAQQNGLNATGQDAVNIANMMGKAMQGQTAVLTRVGITFTEAQEEVLKFGTESERAAMLAQVITDNVGEMNAALAKTDAGKAKQAANDLGDMQEVWGGFIAKYEKSITVISQGTIAVSSFMSAFHGLRGVLASFGGVFGGWTNAARKMLTGTKALATGFRTLTAASTSAGVAIRGLLVASGVGVALAALYTIIEKLTGAQSKTTEATEAVSRVQAKAGEQYAEQSSRVRTLTGLIHDENIATETRKKYIEELKGIVPGYNVMLSEEGKITGENKDAIDEYLTSLEKKIKLQAAEEELTDLYRRQRQELKRLKEEEEALRQANVKKNIAEFAATTNSMRFGTSGMQTLSKGTDSGLNQAQGEYNNAAAAVEKTKASLAGLDAAIAAVNKEIADGSKSMAAGTNNMTGPGGGGNDGGEAYLKAQNCLLDYDNAIAYHKKLQQTATKEEYRNIQSVIDALEKRRAAFIGQTAKAPVENRSNAVQTPVESPAYTPAPVEELNTIGELTKAIQYYKEVQQGQTDAETVNTQRTIDQLEAKKRSMQQLLALPALEADTARLEDLEPEKLQMELELMGVDKVQEKIALLQEMLSTAPEGLREEIGKLIPVWKKYETRVGKVEKQHVSAQEVFRAVSSGIGQIGNAVGEGAQEWINWGTNLLGAIASAIPAIASLTVAKKAEATANTEAAVTGAASSVASIPFVGAVLAVAAIASVIAALASIPKFAKGGIAYGPTLGIFGEYSGASNNPEVVAPLDRLRGMLAEPAGAVSGRVQFEIEGRKLVGILSKENNIIKRR